VPKTIRPRRQLPMSQKSSGLTQYVPKSRRRRPKGSLSTREGRLTHSQSLSLALSLSLTLSLPRLTSGFAFLVSLLDCLRHTTTDQLTRPTRPQNTLTSINWPIFDTQNVLNFRLKRVCSRYSSFASIDKERERERTIAQESA
jgi:hypothetical protein